MEATHLLTLPLFLFLFLTTNGVFARHGISIVDKPPAVLDSYGNSLRKGEYYYLMPWFPFWPREGAIIIGVYNYSCRPLLSVTVLLEEVGVPVTFSPIEPDEDEVIRESTDLYIEFSDKLSLACGGSLLRAWPALSLGGVKEDPSSRFKIEKVPGINYYKLVSTLYGQDIGTPRSSLEVGIQNLILTNNTLGFVFNPQEPEMKLPI